MEAQSILDEIRRISSSLCSVSPRYRTKLTGALAIEIIRDRLIRSDIPVSYRDVFLKGDPIEFDVLVVRPTARPLYGIVYDPRDVAAVLEIKFSGVYSQNVSSQLRRIFEHIKLAHSHIQCVYITVCESPKYKYRMTTEVLGFPAFTLNWWKDGKRTYVNPGNEWHEVVSCLRNALTCLPVPTN
jgi:hypothetical protein